MHPKTWEQRSYISDSSHYFIIQRYQAILLPALNSVNLNYQDINQVNLMFLLKRAPGIIKSRNGRNQPYCWRYQFIKTNQQETYRIKPSRLPQKSYGTWTRASEEIANILTDAHFTESIILVQTIKKAWEK